MDVSTSITTIACAGILIVWLGPRLGAALKIPLFVRWSNFLAEKQRISQQRFSISFDSDTIKAVDLREPKKQPLELQWSEIDRHIVFKRDLFAVDLICLVVGLSGERAIELDEHMEGWNAFIDALPKYLPGCRRLEDWIFDVGSPAFAANPTEIYRREAARTE